MEEQKTTTVLAAIAVAAGVGGNHADPDETVIDNGTGRVGIHLDYGGSMTCLRHANDGRNLVNNFDRGRHVQQSYYSGPPSFDPNGTQHPGYPNWPWNPVQAGDVYNNNAGLLEHGNDGTEIYVKSRPMQWALNNVPADAVMETWYRLDGNVVKVRNRLTNARTDTTWYGPRDQELPAVYTVGTLNTLHTYTGDKPFTNGATQTIVNAGPPWAYWVGTEGWAAYTDANQFGVGVYHPTARRFIGGFAGQRGVGGPNDPSTGYISPLHVDVLDHNIVYEFEYDLIVGSLAQIRAHVNDNHRDLRPNARFVGSRHHWSPAGPGVSDAGMPDERGWRLSLHSSDPQIRGPVTAFQAADTPTLYIEMAVHLNAPGNRTAQLFWTALSEQGGVSETFVAQQSQSFTVIGDGAYRVYELKLSENANWKGLITQLRLDPVTSGGAGEHVFLRSISFANPIPEPGAAAGLMGIAAIGAMRGRAVCR